MKVEESIKKIKEFIEDNEVVMNIYKNMQSLNNKLGEISIEFKDLKSMEEVIQALKIIVEELEKYKERDIEVIDDISDEVVNTIKHKQIEKKLKEVTDRLQYEIEKQNKSIGWNNADDKDYAIFLLQNILNICNGEKEDGK